MFRLTLMLLIAGASSAASAQTSASPKEASVSDTGGQTVLPAGVNAPAWAKPESSPSPRSETPPVEVEADAGPTIYSNDAPDARFNRGAIVNDAQNVPSGAIVSAGSRLAIVVIGSHRIQVPADSITGEAGKLVLALSAADIENVLAATTKFYAETTKLRLAQEKQAALSASAAQR